ncbi:hypothetical protein OJAV_G00050810 [Oryzias javanicus]|uniref:Uncharacterized protein n=1 Tax=Oryzias javanicus TaxID=123683 RepID=A0A3S2UHW9_ORYJA|nr:hypothetical protein OJAV_G00050810 [Oryzias javanicus]
MGAESVLVFVILAVCSGIASGLPVDRKSQNADELLGTENGISSLSNSLGLLQSVDSFVNNIKEVQMETNE